MKNRIKVFHVRDDSRAMTVASEVNEQENEVKLGFAFCNDKDNFSKKIGRVKAVGRMKSNDDSITTHFHGHSADSIVNVFNQDARVLFTDAGFNIPKPHKWRDGVLANIQQTGLTFAEEA